MKKLSFVLSLLVLASLALLTACTETDDSETEPVPTEDQTPLTYTTFSDPYLGVAFEYPDMWSNATIVDVAEDNAFILENGSCTEKCAGLSVVVRTKENYDYDYNRRLNLLGLYTPTENDDKASLELFAPLAKEKIKTQGTFSYILPADLPKVALPELQI